MRTPYDTLLRLRQRELDEMSVAINVQIKQVVSIETRHVMVNNALVAAQEVASSDVLLSTHGYMARMRAERAAIRQDQEAASARLAQLRANATEAYGALKSTRSAADDYRAAVEKEEANAVQSMVDDLTGARGGRIARPRRP